MKILNNSLIYFILIIIFLNYSFIVNILSNINAYILPNDKIKDTEINILKEENDYLKDEISKITNLNSFASYNYKISRLSYKDVKNKNIFYINGGKNDNFKENYALVNNDGLIGIITNTFDTYSKCVNLLESNNISIKINNYYGTISKSKSNILISEDFSNHDKVSINDVVYISDLGIVKEKIKVGFVKDVKTTNLTKTIYIEPYVDFNNISYMYVIGD